MSREVGHGPERRGVSPLQIVERDDERHIVCERGKRGGQLARPGRRCRPESRALADEPRAARSAQRGASDRERRNERRHGAAARAHGVEPGQERLGFRQMADALAGRRVHARARARDAQKHVTERRLADAQLAGDQHDTRGPRAHGVERIDERRELAGTIHEQRQIGFTGRSVADDRSPRPRTRSRGRPRCGRSADCRRRRAAQDGSRERAP